MAILNSELLVYQKVVEAHGTGRYKEISWKWHRTRCMCQHVPTAERDKIGTQSILRTGNWKLETGNWLCMAVWFACLLCFLGVSQDKSVLAIFSNLLLGMRLQLRKHCWKETAMSKNKSAPWWKIRKGMVSQKPCGCVMNCMAPQIQRFITSRILEPCPYISVNYNDLTATSL